MGFRVTPLPSLLLARASTSLKVYQICHATTSHALTHDSDTRYVSLSEKIRHGYVKLPLQQQRQRDVEATR